MRLFDIIHSLTHQRTQKREPHIVLQEYVQGVYRYTDYPAMAKLYAEKAKKYALEQHLTIPNRDQKIVEKYA